MFAIQVQTIDSQSLRRQLNNPRAGALVSFEGLVRNHSQGRAVRALEYEACESLAQAEAARIFVEARARFEIEDLICVHRCGLLQIGEAAVWIGVTAAHRDAAFAACRYLIEQLKQRLPIWKQEHYHDGASEWVNACAGCQTC